MEKGGKGRTCRKRIVRASAFFFRSAWPFVAPAKRSFIWPSTVTVGTTGRRPCPLMVPGAQSREREEEDGKGGCLVRGKRKRLGGHTRVHDRRSNPNVRRVSVLIRFMDGHSYHNNPCPTWFGTGIPRVCLLPDRPTVSPLPPSPSPFLPSTVSSSRPRFPSSHYTSPAMVPDTDTEAEPQLNLIEQVTPS